jgi:hypothetical protein
MAPSLYEVSVECRSAQEGADARVAVPLRTSPTGGTLRLVEDTHRDDLRRLALWLSRRRAVDEAVAVLTAYGPAASSRVHAHLDALDTLLEAEHEAFGALRAAAPRVTQLPLPDTVPESARPGATVHSIGAARGRHLS